MRNRFTVLFFALLTNLLLGQELTELTGDYLGQPLPGKIPVVFARGIVSTADLEHSAPRFTPDGNRVYWSAGWKSKIKSENRRRTLMMRRINNTWTQPEVVQEFPYISPDGRRFYLSKDPPPIGSSLLVRKKDTEGYAATYIHLLSKFPQLKYTLLPSVTGTGAVYFLSYLEGMYNGFGIYRSEPVPGGYSKPEPLPPSINKPGMLNWTPYISPDESFLIFSSNRHDPGKDWGDLFISHRLPDGDWTEPVNLGKTVNTPEQERFPMISPDGKYLFFTRPTPEFDQDVYWVDAKFLQAFGPSAIVSNFGQSPPGMTPNVFVSHMRLEKHRRHGFPAFSPDGREVYWPVIPPRIMFMKYENGAWTSPAVAPFSERNSQAPNFSPDGSRLYYQVSRKDGLGSLDIWYVERTASGWGEPQNIGPPVNTEKLESQPSLTEDGTVYFTGTREGAMWNRGLYRAECENGVYSEPELLGDSINTKYLEIYPFVAPDESYLLFCSTRPSMDEKNQRIFVSFRSKNGKWSEPVNLNKKINFDHTSSFPYVSPDGKFLFFYAKGDLYWVDAGVIHQIKP